MADDLLDLTAAVTKALRSNGTTQVYDSKEYRSTRDLLVNIFYGLTGLLVVIFNSSLLWLYFKRLNIRRHFSALMISLFSFCVFHGFMMGITFPLHRVNRYAHSDFLCVLGVLVMEFCDNFVIILCIFLAIERLLAMVAPLMKKRTAQRWSIGGIVISILIVILCSWMPMIPHIAAEAERADHENADENARISKFYMAFSCNEKINRRNMVSYAFMLSLYVVAFFLIIGCYVFMYLNVRFTLLSSYRAVSDNRKKTLNKFTASVFTLSVAFLVTTMPYGILQNARNLCGHSINKESDFCKHIGLNLRFAFGILQHVGDLVAPMIFAFQLRPIRISYLNYFFCRHLKEENSVRSESEDRRDIVTVTIQNDSVKINGIEETNAI